MHDDCAPTALPTSAWQRLPYVLRMGGAAALFSLGIGLLNYAFWRHDLGVNLVYSLCIGLCCWAFIDSSRILSARLMRRWRPPAEAQRADWPGWPVMALCLLLAVPLAYSTGISLADLLTGRRGLQIWDQRWTELYGALLFSLLASVVATAFFFARHRLATAKAQAEQAQRIAAETQLRLLQSQLEPHMLFNTLANLRVLIALDPPRAQAMLDQLIGFLRATLNASRVGQHSLREEFARLNDYLALMQIRMGGRLRPRLELPDALAELPVPPLLLQPLVENAIKHGLEPHVDGGELIVSARLDAGQLLLQVRDTGVGPGLAGAPAREAGSGFGLEQVRQRLATQFGPGASLRIETATDGCGGTLVSLRLPIQPKPEVKT